MGSVFELQHTMLHLASRVSERTLVACVEEVSGGKIDGLSGSLPDEKPRCEDQEHFPGRRGKAS